MTMAFKNDRQRKAVMAKLNSRGNNRIAVQPTVTRPTILFARHPENLSKVQEKRLTAKSIPEKEAVRELELFTTNDGELYRGQYAPIIANLEKKMDKGTYDRDKAKLSFLNLVENASRKYKKDFGTPDSKIFTKSDKLAVASRLEKDFRQESALGNYKDFRQPQ